MLFFLICGECCTADWIRHSRWSCKDTQLTVNTRWGDKKWTLSWSDPTPLSPLDSDVLACLLCRQVQDTRPEHLPSSGTQTKTSPPLFMLSRCLFPAHDSYKNHLQLRPPRCLSQMWNEVHTSTSNAGAAPPLPLESVKSPALSRPHPPATNNVTDPTCHSGSLKKVKMWVDDTLTFLEQKQQCPLFPLNYLKAQCATFTASKKKYNTVFVFCCVFTDDQTLVFMQRANPLVVVYDDDDGRWCWKRGYQKTRTNINAGCRSLHDHWVVWNPVHWPFKSWFQCWQFFKGVIAPFW